MVSSNAESGPAAAPTSVVASLDQGLDPQVLRKSCSCKKSCDCARVAHVWKHSPTDIFGGTVECGDTTRAYMITEADQVSRFLPADITRERNLPLLIGWEFVKLLPPDWYAIVFGLRAVPGTYRAVPESKLALDGFPAAVSKAADPEKQAGFDSQKDLRLVLRPEALRFFWAGLHEPLRVPGAWPTTRQVMMRGFELSEDARSALHVKLASVPAEMSALLRSRHWPRGGGQAEAAGSRQPETAGPVEAICRLPLRQALAVVSAALERLPAPGDESLAEEPERSEDGDWRDWLPAASERVIDAVQALEDERAIRSMPPDCVAQHGGSEQPSEWCYDLDSIVVVSTAPLTFGFARILQRIPVEAREQWWPMHKNMTVCTRPIWASAVASCRPPLSWAPDWEGKPNWDPRLETTASAYDDSEQYEYRIWQFVAPRGVMQASGPVDFCLVETFDRVASSSEGQLACVIFGAHRPLGDMVEPNPPMPRPQLEKLLPTPIMALIRSEERDERKRKAEYHEDQLERKRQRPIQLWGLETRRGPSGITVHIQALRLYGSSWWHPGHGWRRQAEVTKAEERQERLDELADLRDMIMSHDALSHLCPTAKEQIYEDIVRDHYSADSWFESQRAMRDAAFARFKREANAEFPGPPVRGEGAFAFA